MDKKQKNFFFNMHVNLIFYFFYLMKVIIMNTIKFKV